MKRWLAIAVVGLMLAVPAASAASEWLQPRGDPAATGFQPAEGPAWPDVALRIGLPGHRPIGDPPGPLVLEDRVLVLAERTSERGDGTGDVLSVDLDTGNVTSVAEVAFRSPMTMATDGRTVYVTSEGTVRAVPLEPGGNAWTWDPKVTPVGEDVPTTDAEERHPDTCRGMALQTGWVTVLCQLDAASVGMTPQDIAFVARLNAATGEVAWTWTPSEEDDNPQAHPSPGVSVPIGLAAAGSRVLVQTADMEGIPGQPSVDDFRASAQRGQIEVWALTEDGGFEWSWAGPTINRTSARTPEPLPDADGFSETISMGNPAATDQFVYAKAKGVHKLSLGSGQPLWHQPIGERDAESPFESATALALGQGQVYALSAQTVYSMGQDEPENGWARSLDLARDQGFSEDPIVTPSTLYTVALPIDVAGEVVYAFDTGDGSVEWTHEVPHNFLKFAVGDGLFVYTDEGSPDEGVPASLVVLGQTPASPEPDPRVSSRYPAPGEGVEVNLSASQAGLQGPVTRYKATWGDGTETPWQTDPVLNHTYDEDGDHAARFTVANDANQTNSTTLTFHVGQEEPVEPNLVETAFQKDNQDMTFGVLGLAVALGGGAIGVARRKRKQSLLQDELDALEQGFEETRDQPSECEALLDNRKARARSLALDGKLDEQQVGIVESRAEELRAELRVDALEEEFGFLPYSLVTKARQMVEDGTVTALERDAFLRAIDEDEVLTSQQKAQVRERIERWHGRDTGGSD